MTTTPAPHESPTLILLPSVGLDHHLFIPQLKAFSDARLPRWADHDHATLQEFARRQLGVLLEEGHVRMGAPYALVGFALGGMVALEMALLALREPEAPDPPTSIVLISAPRTRDAITPRLRRQAAIGSLVPGPVARLGFRFFAGRLARTHRLDPMQTRWLREMSRSLDLPLLKWSGRAARDWDRTDENIRTLTDAGVGIHQVHGRHDDAIPLIDRHADAVLDDANHLITWTHSARVNTEIAGATGVHL